MDIDTTNLVGALPLLSGIYLLVLLSVAFRLFSRDEQGTVHVFLAVWSSIIAYIYASLPQPEAVLYARPKVWLWITVALLHLTMVATKILWQKSHPAQS